MKFRFTVIVSLLYCSLFLTISDAKTINVVYSDERSSAPIRDCRIQLRTLLASSNQHWIAAEHPKPADLDVLMEEHDDRKGMLFIQIINTREAKTDPSPGAGHYGWVLYNKKTGELWDESDEDNPQKLIADPAAVKNYQACSTQDDQCLQANQNMTDDPTGGFYPNPFEVEGDSNLRYIVTSAKRQHFSWAPNKNCEVGAFVVNDDKVLALSWGQQFGYIWSRYTNPATKVITEGWLPQDALKTKEQVCSSIQPQIASVNTEQNFLEPRVVFNHHQRLYFYDAPNDICLRNDGAFIVDNDKVQASDKSSTAGFTFVRFVHPVTKDVTSGWVQSSGLARPQQESR